MRRRAYLRAAGVAGTAGLAGCAGVGSLFETTNSRAPPLVENRPDAVYYPSHVEGMKVAGTGRAGDLEVALFYSYPHRFWTVEKDDGAYVTRKTGIERDDAVHLMALPWDPETGTVVPDTGLSLEITRDGELVSQEVIYAMLSQRMGVHYGANFPLSGDGTYTVTASVGGASLERFGAYEGKFGDAATTDVQFEFSESTLKEIPYRLLEEKAGERGAVDPMRMEGAPVGRAPKSLPGESLGAGTAGDVAFRGTVATADRFGNDPYLAVSPRTPYNRFVVSGMSVAATVNGAKRSLKAGLDPELGFHYGAPVKARPEGDVRVAVEVPPQVARHEGYETAFLDSAATTLS